jgi:molybdate transport system substrate-binding protein
LWADVEQKVVYAENVRQAYKYARTGNADAALTSWTLVFDKQGVLLPGEWHKPIRQVGGAVKGSAHGEAGRKFLAFLKSPEGRGVLRKFGLLPPGGASVR